MEMTSTFTSTSTFTFITLVPSNATVTLNSTTPTPPVTVASPEHTSSTFLSFPTKNLSPVESQKILTFTLTGVMTFIGATVLTLPATSVTKSNGTYLASLLTELLLTQPNY